MPRRPPSGSSESSSSSSLRQLAHDLTNALGGARLRWTLLSTSARLAAPQAENLDALGRLLSEACELTERLQVALADALDVSARR